MKGNVGGPQRSSNVNNNHWSSRSNSNQSSIITGSSCGEYHNNHKSKSKTHQRGHK